jgi:hypothetical protein
MARREAGSGPTVESRQEMERIDSISIQIVPLKA